MSGFNFSSKETLISRSRSILRSPLRDVCFKRLKLLEFVFQDRDDLLPLFRGETQMVENMLTTSVSGLFANCGLGTIS